MARRLSALHDISLKGLSGSGPRGRVLKGDVLARVEQARPAPAASPATAEAAPQQPGPASGVTVAPLSSMRRTLARRLTEAKTTIPPFSVPRRVRADRPLALRSAGQGNGPPGHPP